MLTSLNRIAGMPVIWQDRQIGCVERAIADASARRLRGLVIRKGIGLARWLPSSSVRLVGRTCVLAGAKPEPLPDGLTDSALQAYLTTGERAGLVSNALFSGLTLRLVALEVTPGAGLRASGALPLHGFLSGWQTAESRRWYPS